MKTRNGLVSNSSSCSFTILKKDLTNQQIYMINNHIEYAKKLGMESLNYPWHIDEYELSLKFSTDMDNFDMKEFLRNIDVDISKIQNEEHG